MRCFAIGIISLVPWAQNLAQESEISIVLEDGPAGLIVSYEATIFTEGLTVPINGGFFGFETSFQSFAPVGVLGLMVDNNNGNVNVFEALGSDELIDFVPGNDALIAFESTNAISITGDDFGFIIAGTALPTLNIYVPENFVSGSTLSGAATFTDLAFDDLSSLVGETRTLDLAGNITVSFETVTEIVLGDSNLDGEVNFFDIAPFITVLANGSFLEQADVNQDDEVNFFDIAPLIAILTG